MLKYCSFGAVALTAVGCSQSAESVKPNVIYVLVDDLGYGDLSCYGQSNFQTPNIDAMASRGMRFTQNYSGSTVSAPSRCALMTGKHTGNTYIRGNRSEKGSDGRVYDTPIPLEEFTMAELFKSEGYATGCIGKWGLGGVGSIGHPNNQGFDYFYGCLGQAFAHNYYPEYLHENSEEVALDGQYSHEAMEGKVTEFISENRDNPFFLYLTYTIPHAELLLPEEDLAKFRGKFPEDKPFVKVRGNYSSQAEPHAAFAAMVTRLDESIGLLFEQLDELGLTDNTLVIFTSDNGPHMEGGADPEFFKSSGIYRGFKRALYEGGIRVPMIAHYPGVIAPGSQCDEPIAFWDVMPTMAEIISAEIPQDITVDGLSFLPLFSGEEMEQKHDYFYWEFMEQGGRQAVLRGDWKLIKHEVRTTEKSYYELFNIATDPSETTNVVEANPQIFEQLKSLMENTRVDSKYWKF
ncbi:MAG: arylsulfatase [Rikenellaceae bacterium]